MKLALIADIHSNLEAIAPRPDRVRGLGPSPILRPSARRSPSGHVIAEAPCNVMVLRPGPEA
jgi:hypothetical protein